MIARGLLCSAHVQVSICLNLQCPPEGGLHNSVEPVLPVVVFSTVITTTSAAAMFLLRSASFSLIRALVIRTFVHFVVLGSAVGWAIAVDALVGMSVFDAVVPVSSPPGVVEEHGVAAPVKAVIAPTPRPER